MWEIVNNRRIIVGEGALTQIGGILAWHGLKKAFLAVFSTKADAYGAICAVLKDSGVDYVVYDKIVDEPDLTVINEGRDLFVNKGCDCVIAVGGGSVIDTAKSVGMLAANGGNIEQYQMEGKAVTKLPPLFIAVPTTAGTGAEATKVSVVKNNINGLKKSLYHTTMIAEIAILDPVLSVGLPAPITAATGMDALSHAIESYVSLNANPVSEMYSLKALELIARNLVAAYNEPDNLDARENMLLGSYLGGCALTAGIGLAHIMAQPVGAMFKIPHGDACSIFLPEVMKLNLHSALDKYVRIARELGVDSGASKEQIAAAGIARVEALRTAVNAPERLKPYIKDEPVDMDKVLDTVLKTTGHIKCNPRSVGTALIRDVFNKVL
ncbi:MAG: iron-containing alcohol dehydrogenase [Negativicutes bacterium]|nr:iron-containing alcohol dehydrogenase [Negativicutes bacterium]